MQNKKVIYSARLGKTRMKEQYVLGYNWKRLKLIEYTTVKNTNFHRPPMICYFKTLDNHFDFILIIIHTDPDEVKKEIDNLFLTVQNIIKKYPNERDIIVTGDLNANPKKIMHILTTTFGFYTIHYLGIKFAINQKTTRRHIYDNFIFSRKYTTEFKSAKVIYFDYQLKYSDHFPIQAIFTIPDKDDD